MALFGFPRAFMPHAAWTDVRLFFAIATALALRARSAAGQGLRPIVYGRCRSSSSCRPARPRSSSGVTTFPCWRSRCSRSCCFSAATSRLRRSGRAGGPPQTNRLAAHVRARGRRPKHRSPPAVAISDRAGRRSARGACHGQGIPAGFVDDVILFPQGLSSLPSPAASATIGSLVVAAVPCGGSRTGPSSVSRCSPALLCSCAGKEAGSVRASGGVGRSRDSAHARASRSGRPLRLLRLSDRTAHMGHVAQRPEDAPARLSARARLLPPRRNRRCERRADRRAR